MMQAHEHFATGQDLLAQAAQAGNPDRLIGMAQAHFLAAQTIIQANTYHMEYRLEDDEKRAWAAAIRQKYRNGRRA